MDRNNLESMLEGLNKSKLTLKEIADLLIGLSNPVKQSLQIKRDNYDLASLDDAGVATLAARANEATVNKIMGRMEADLDKIYARFRNPTESGELLLFGPAGEPHKFCLLKESYEELLGIITDRVKQKSLEFANAAEDINAIINGVLSSHKGYIELDVGRMIEFHDGDDLKAKLIKIFDDKINGFLASLQGMSGEEQNGLLKDAFGAVVRFESSNGEDETSWHYGQLFNQRIAEQAKIALHNEAVGAALVQNVEKLCDIVKSATTETSESLAYMKGIEPNDSGLMNVELGGVEAVVVDPFVLQTAINVLEAILSADEGGLAALKTQVLSVLDAMDAVTVPGVARESFTKIDATLLKDVITHLDPAMLQAVFRQLADAESERSFTFDQIVPGVADKTALSNALTALQDKLPVQIKVKLFGDEPLAAEPSSPHVTFDEIKQIITSTCEGLYADAKDGTIVIEALNGYIARLSSNGFEAVGVIEVFGRVDHIPCTRDLVQALISWIQKDLINKYEPAVEAQPQPVHSQGPAEEVASTPKSNADGGSKEVKEQSTVEVQPQPGHGKGPAEEAGSTAKPNAGGGSKGSKAIQKDVGLFAGKSSGLTEAARRGRARMNLGQTKSSGKW